MDMTTSEKVAYLKGLLDATNFEDKDTKKILGAFLKVFNSLVEDVEANAENIDNIDSRLTEVDEDLGAVEAMVYGDYEDEISFDDDFEEEPFDFSDDEIDDDLEEDEIDDDFDDEDFDFENDEPDEDFEDEVEEASAPEMDVEEPETESEAEVEEETEEETEEFDDEEDGEELYEIECPACHETIYLQESVILAGGVDCPACGEPLEFDIEFEEE